MSEVLTLEKGVKRLEKEVGEIKQSLKETSEEVRDVRVTLARIETTLDESNKRAERSFVSLGDIATVNQEKINHIERQLSDDGKEIKHLDERVTALEQARNRIVWAIVMAVLGALFSLIFIK